MGKYLLDWRLWVRIDPKRSALAKLTRRTVLLGDSRTGELAVNANSRSLLPAAGDRSDFPIVWYIGSTRLLSLRKRTKS